MSRTSKPGLIEVESRVKANKQLRKARGSTVVARYFAHLSSNSDRRVAGLKIITTVALFCGLALSWRLWVSSRLFPLSPLTRLLPVMPSPVDQFCLAALLGMLLMMLITARPRMLIFSFLALAISLSLLDQNRWQPWFYQYSIMLLAMALFAWQESGVKNSRAVLRCCQVVVASTYFWSGMQKLNVNFATETWPDIAGPLLQRLPGLFSRMPPYLILMIPLVEIAVGIGLLTRRWRTAAVAVAITTHVFILILLIWSGENTVVWPWNLAMIAFVVVLFWRDSLTSFRDILVPTGIFHGLLVLLFGVLPVLSFFGLWDSYLSATLYSGNTDQAVIYVNPQVIAKLPPAMHEHIWQRSKPFFADINRWSYGELNVPLYPEPRVYKSIMRDVCAYAGPSSPDLRLRIKEKPNIFTAQRKSEYYDCDHLEEILSASRNSCNNTRIMRMVALIWSLSVEAPKPPVMF